MPYVFDDLQKKIHEVLAADAEINTLLGGVANDRIIWHHPPQNAIPDEGPYVVFFRAGQSEDRKWRPIRKATVIYSFQVWDLVHDSQPARNVANKIVNLLDGQEVKLLTCSITPMSVIFDDVGPELYDEQVNQWFYETRAELIVELRDV